MKDILMFKAFIFWGGFFFFLLLELLRPYRKSSVSKAGRLVINISLAVLNSIVLNLIFASTITDVSEFAAARRSGLLSLTALPLWGKVLLTVVFMDFITYVWHLLNHVVPLLWRFHRVHHSDINMDVSTASRFHIGELLISNAIKISLIFFLGADIPAVAAFEILLVLAAQFQHSSLFLPGWFENILWVLFVPPSMHRIHHSVVIKERDTNYGTIFSLWDRMLGTFLRQIGQDRIIIGMGAYRNPESLKLHHLMLMPFTPPVK
ncbi:MAG: sterol desaturase family protein [Nitrospirae bacterium]|nr:sterol desaturase family protein [Nitrospirota bacterium]